MERAPGIPCKSAKRPRTSDQEGGSATADGSQGEGSAAAAAAAPTPFTLASATSASGVNGAAVAINILVPKKKKRRTGPAPGKNTKKKGGAASGGGGGAAAKSSAKAKQTKKKGKGKAATKAASTSKKKGGAASKSSAKAKQTKTKGKGKATTKTKTKTKTKSKSKKGAATASGLNSTAVPSKPALQTSMSLFTELQAVPASATSAAAAAVGSSGDKAPATTVEDTASTAPGSGVTAGVSTNTALSPVEKCAVELVCSAAACVQPSGGLRDGANAEFQSALSQLLQLFAGDGSTGCTGALQHIDPMHLRSLLSFASHSGGDHACRSDVCRLVGNVLLCMCNTGASDTPRLAAQLMHLDTGMVPCVATVLAEARACEGALSPAFAKLVKNALRMVLSVDYTWEEATTFRAAAAQVLMEPLGTCLAAGQTVFTGHAAAVVRQDEGAVWSCM